MHLIAGLTGTRGFRILLLAAVVAASPGVARAAETGGEPVDLELVLAVDISYSMDIEEQKIQRDGYAAAITSKPVLDAIRAGMIGKIAIAYVEWAGSDEQRTIVDWRTIDSADSAAAFAARLEAEPLRRAYRTSLSGALVHAARSFDGNGFQGARMVIDISGDGPNNQGLMVESVRDEIVERGVVINGLPLMLNRPTSATFDMGDLAAYYRDCVIGGPGAFVIPVRGVEQFPDAVRTKLVTEIAGLAVPPPPGIPPIGTTHAIPAQADEPEASCMVGEQLWRDRFGN